MTPSRSTSHCLSTEPLLMLKLPLNVRHLSCFVPYFVFWISIFWISFFYILHLYIATPPCWLLCITLLTPFLRSAQMNSKSSKSALCCEPCESISILRIVCRLSFSFIFSNAQQLHSLLRCMIVFCLFLKTIVKSKRLRPLIFLDQSSPKSSSIVSIVLWTLSGHLDL